MPRAVRGQGTGSTGRVHAVGDDVTGVSSGDVVIGFSDTHYGEGLEAGFMTRRPTGWTRSPPPPQARLLRLRLRAQGVATTTHHDPKDC